jgi:hypothetical protein
MLLCMKRRDMILRNTLYFGKSPGQLFRQQPFVVALNRQAAAPIRPLIGERANNRISPALTPSLAMDK